ncbi:MAG: 3-dehydroquinate synthase [Cyclobacteriaceae bacterium]
MSTLLEKKSIHIGSVGDTLSSYLGKHTYSNIIVLVDENTYEHCLPIISHLIKGSYVVKIKSGEENKTLATCEIIWQHMTDSQLDRKALMINLGGGVIGDMGGFCAASYKRGIDFIQIPTTLLSQVDASVGGKLGIDFHSFKNHIGFFKEPNAVLIDTVFLDTLEVKEVRSGYAEIIKHCLISDADEWQKIKATPYEAMNWNELVPHSIDIKAQVVEEDPLEKGWRKVLNFGHTIGHGIESHYLTTPNRLLHGEAIAVGMITEAYLSHTKGYISETDLKEVTTYILSVYGKVELKENLAELILPTILQDKKNENKEIKCTLLEKVGKGIVNIPINEKEITEAINYYISL